MILFSSTTNSKYYPVLKLIQFAAHNIFWRLYSNYDLQIFIKIFNNLELYQTPSEATINSRNSSFFELNIFHEVWSLIEKMEKNFKQSHELSLFLLVKK